MHVSAEMPPRPDAPDSLGALVPGPVARIAGNPQPDLPLAGRRFVVKDVIDVAGFVTGAGNPDWARTHAPATVHATVVQLLLDAGVFRRIMPAVGPENLHRWPCQCYGYDLPASCTMERI
jgi:Amidase